MGSCLLGNAAVHAFDHFARSEGSSHTYLEQGPPAKCNSVLKTTGVFSITPSSVSRMAARNVPIEWLSKVTARESEGPRDRGLARPKLKKGSASQKARETETRKRPARLTSG